MRHGLAVAAAFLWACSSASASAPPNDASTDTGDDGTDDFGVPCARPPSCSPLLLNESECPADTILVNACQQQFCCPAAGYDAGADATTSSDASADVSEDVVREPASDSAGNDGTPDDAAADGFDSAPDALPE